VNLGSIDDATFVGAVEAAGLDPGVREVPLAVLPEEDHPAYGRDLPSLVVREEPEGFQIAAGELAACGERLGSGSEVDGFRVEPGDRLFVESLASREAPHFLDQLRVGAAVCRPDPDVDAVGWPFP
jgi:hypothetical protein